jgi:hypothetical protein
VKNTRSLLAFVALSLLLTGSAFAQSSLDVNATAAMNGTSFGLEVILNNSTDLAYTQDNSPTDDTVYRASFWFDANSIAMPTATRFPIFLGRDDSLGNRLRLQMQYHGPSDNYRLRLQGRNFAGDFVNALSTVNNAQWLAIGAPGNGPVQVTLEAVFAGAGGASLCLQANGLTHDKTGFGNGNQGAIDNIRFGATRSIAATFNGSFYLDEFESFRTLSPTTCTP